MAIGITNADITAFLAGHSITITSGTAFVSSCILAADAYMEKALNRSYGLDSSTSARRFDGAGTPDIGIDDCQDIATVELMDNDGSVSETLAATDYISAPYNTDNKSLLHRYNCNWLRGYGNVRVTAKWGETPTSDISDAATKKAVLMILSGSNLPTVGGSVNTAAQSYSTGVWSVNFKQSSTAAQQDVIGLLSGWQQDIDNTITLRKKPVAF